MAVPTAPSTTRPRVADLVDATPDDRDRVVDFVRVPALAVVVLGHWLMASVTWRQGGGSR